MIRICIDIYEIHTSDEVEIIQADGSLLEYRNV